MVLLISALWTAPLGLDRFRRDVAPSDEAGRRAPRHGSETEIQRRPQAAGSRGVAGRQGDPFHNAQAESFLKTLKQEEVTLTQYQNFEEAAASIGSFVEQVYNG